MLAGCNAMAKKDKPYKSEFIQNDEQHYIDKEFQEFSDYRNKIEKHRLFRLILMDIEYALWSHGKCDKLHLATEDENTTHKEIVKSLRGHVDEIYYILGKIFPDIEKNQENEGFELLCRLLDNMKYLFFDAMDLGNYTRIIYPYREKLAHHRKQRLRGKQSALSRAKKAEETWHKTALELASKSRMIDPSLSQDDVASYVWEHWNSQKISRPSHTTLRIAVSRWIKEKKLPNKSR